MLRSKGTPTPSSKKNWMSSPGAGRKIWDYSPRDEEEAELENDSHDRPAIPSRTASRGSDKGVSKRASTSRHNSRTAIPTLSLSNSQNERNRRTNSNTSLDSEALFQDHRQVSHSLPRTSFLKPKHASMSSASGRRKSTRGNYSNRSVKKSNLGRMNDVENVDEDTESSSDDERSGLIMKQKRDRRKSSSQQSTRAFGGRRGSENYGSTAVDANRLSPPNPNYPPSIPSSFGSRRGSQEQFGPNPRLRESISGKDDTGAPVRVNMAQRVLDYAHRRSSSAGQEHQESSSSLADLPDAISSSPPGNFRERPQDSAAEDDDETDKPRNRLMSRAEVDVCFPLSEETGHQGHIDFEELAEWSREQIDQKEDGGDHLEWRHRKLSEPMLVNGKYRNRGGWMSSDRSDEDDRPFRFTFFSDELASTIHSPTLYELPQEDQSFEDLFTTGNTWWLDVNCPSDSEMKILSSAFGIHPLTAEDISMEEQREKVELFRNYYLVSFRSFQQDPNSEDYLEPVNMYIVVFKDGVLSFHFNTTPHPANVRRRIRQLRDYITVSSDWISYALIDDIVDAFSPLIHRIEYEVDTIDENVLGIDIDNSPTDSEQSSMLRRIGACRKKVMGLLRLLGSKADVVKGFAKRCNEHWDVAPRSEIGLYLGDIQDHIVTMVQNLNHYEKILSRSHSNYLAQISIEMTKVNNDTNDVLSRLTVLGTMLIPMNLVTGLWGMNVPVPGQESDGVHWFFSIIGCMCIFFVLVYFVGRRSGVV